MTDTEIKRRKAICEVAGVKEIEDVTDGFHTFKELYYQRMMLFVTIVKQNKDKAWKSLRHEDGELCFGGGWFIVGIDTPEGSYTYHYEDNYYSLFDCEELECGKHWDGHTEKDVTRLLSIPFAQSEPCEDAVSREFLELVVQYPPRDLCTYPEYRDKPYYSIKYYENGECHVGYGTYNPEVLSRFLKDYFITPVKPQEKTGRWIIVDDCEHFIAKCSECGRIENSRMISKYPYCHCGAKMVETQESEVQE